MRWSRRLGTGSSCWRSDPSPHADTATGLCPDPGDGLQGALAPYVSDVPYSRLHSVTAPRFGFTVALITAVVSVIPDAEPVTASGAAARDPVAPNS